MMEYYFNAVETMVLCRRDIWNPKPYWPAYIVNIYLGLFEFICPCFSCKNNTKEMLICICDSCGCKVTQEALRTNKCGSGKSREVSVIERKNTCKTFQSDQSDSRVKSDNNKNSSTQRRDYKITNSCVTASVSLSLWTTTNITWAELHAN